MVTAILLTKKELFAHKLLGIVYSHENNEIFKFQFIVLFKTFPLGGRCPRKGADEGKIRPLISQKSKIFASFSPGRSFCAFGAVGTINPNLVQNRPPGGRPVCYGSNSRIRWAIWQLPS